MIPIRGYKKIFALSIIRCFMKEPFDCCSHVTGTTLCGVGSMKLLHRVLATVTCGTIIILLQVATFTNPSFSCITCYPSRHVPKVRYAVKYPLNAVWNLWNDGCNDSAIAASWGLVSVSDWFLGVNRLKDQYIDRIDIRWGFWLYLFYYLSLW